MIFAHLKRNTDSVRDFPCMQSALMLTHTAAFCVAGCVAVKGCFLKSWYTDLMVWLGEKGIGVNKRRVVW